jgi:hypothetical protein
MTRAILVVGATCIALAMLASTANQASAGIHVLSKHHVAKSVHPRPRK